MNPIHVRRAAWVLYALLWLGGIATRGVAPNTGWASPLFLIVAGSLALSENPGAWRSLALAAGLGCGFELLGVHTGLPFGRYSYSPALGPAFYGVPFTMAFAWLILIDFARAVTKSPFLGAVVMVGVDFALDPVAAGPLQYWRWLDGGAYFGIPWTNFAGWLVASWAILAVLPPSPRGTGRVGWSVVGFFAALALAHGLWLPGAVGVAVVALTGLVLWRNRSTDPKTVYNQ